MIIPFSTGIPSLLKEKGFDEPVFGFYTENQELVISPCITGRASIFDKHTLAPTYDDVIDWLEREHEIVIYPKLLAVGNWDCVIIDEPEKTHKGSGNMDYFDKINSIDNKGLGFATRYDALNEGIKEALKIIKG